MAEEMMTPVPKDVSAPLRTGEACAVAVACRSFERRDADRVPGCSVSGCPASGRSRSMRMLPLLLAALLVTLSLQGCSASGRLRDATDETAAADEEAEAMAETPAMQALGDWLPYQVDDTPMSPLDPYRMNKGSAAGADSGAGAASDEAADNGGIVYVPYESLVYLSETTGEPGTASYRPAGMMENWPFALIPLVESTEVVYADGDIDYFYVSILSPLSPDEALAFYERLLADKRGFQKYDADETGIQMNARVAGADVQILVGTYDETRSSIELGIYKPEEE